MRIISCVALTISFKGRALLFKVRWKKNMEVLLGCRFIKNENNRNGNILFAEVT
jgi:hypothetical protein